MNVLNKGIAFLSAGIVLMMMSCSNEAPWSASGKADGKINLSVETDGKILMGTRADDVSPLVPNANEFSISLKSIDGSYDQTWKTLNSFNDEDGFPMGSYHISASFGSMDSEGFSNPYFYGESAVTVLKGESSNVGITATLANAMISIRYSDDFSNFFPGHSCIVSTGKEPVIFVQSESRPAYISTGNAELKLTLTNSANQTVTLSPASFKAEPRKHYIVTFGVEGNTNIGYGSLNVEWSEEVVSEEREITLSEEMFTTPPPAVSLEGFSVTEPLFEGLDYEAVNPEFHVMALAGLDEAKLTLTASSNGVLPLSFEEIDLVNADENSYLLLKNAGIEPAGFNDKVSQFGVINFKEYIKKLAPGSYGASLEVTDSYGRSIETPVELNVTIKGIEYKFLSYTKPDFNSDEIIVMVESNSEIIKNQLVFTADDGSDLNVLSAECISEEKPVSPETSLDYVFTYKLKFGNKINDCKVKVQTFVPTKTRHNLDADVEMPAFTIERDAFARYVKMKLGADIDEALKKLILEKGVIYDSGVSTSIKLSNIYDAASDQITLTGFDPNKTYNYAVNLGKTFYSGYNNNAQFRTEVAADVPNGNFENLVETINEPDIKAGGQLKYGANKMQNYTNILVNEPEGWSSINKKTCYHDSQNRNTWYMVPSTLAANNEVLIRSVAYDHAGEEIQLDDHGLSVKRKYSRKYPQNFANYAAGELFLGNYSYDSNGEDRSGEGVIFESRPSKITFDYTYLPIGSEKGEVKVEIFDSEDNLIAETKSEIDNRLTKTTMSLEIKGYDKNFMRKAGKLKISFISSTEATPSAPVPTDLDDLPDKTSSTTGLSDKRIDTNAYKSLCTGSELRISNVHFEY